MVVGLCQCSEVNYHKWSNLHFFKFLGEKGKEDETLVIIHCINSCFLCHFVNNCLNKAVIGGTLLFKLKKNPNNY